MHFPQVIITYPMYISSWKVYFKTFIDHENEVEMIWNKSKLILIENILMGGLM